jgi:hypothetical protein
MLLAQRLEGVGRVVTIAANLDTDAWTGLHGYSPLAASLNPMTEPPLPDDVSQLHLAGGLDWKVPPAQIESALRVEADAELAVLPGFDHHCCWESIWPAVLDAVRAREDVCGYLRREWPNTQCDVVSHRPD